MSGNLVTMQHASKDPAGFSHEGFSVTSDEDGVISIPSHFAGHARAHGFSSDVAPKVVKPLAKAAKGGEDAPEAGDGSKPAEGESLKLKGAKAAKGGEQ